MQRGRRPDVLVRRRPLVHAAVLVNFLDGLLDEAFELHVVVFVHPQRREQVLFIFPLVWDDRGRQRVEQLRNVRLIRVVVFRVVVEEEHVEKEVPRLPRAAAVLPGARNGTGKSTLDRVLGLVVEVVGHRRIGDAAVLANHAVAEEVAERQDELGGADVVEIRVGLLGEVVDGHGADAVVVAAVHGGPRLNGGGHAVPLAALEEQHGVLVSYDIPILLQLSQVHVAGHVGRHLAQPLEVAVEADPLI